MNIRHMVAAATVFFWDRERITNQDVMRYGNHVLRACIK